jgi:uncharacterized membrane protein
MTAHQKLKICYAAFALCVVTTCIPQMDIQTFSMIFSIAMIIGFYVVRKPFGKESFEYKESSILIKTFWAWSAIYVVGMMVAGILISQFGDMTAMNEWAASIEQGAIPDEENVKRMTDAYMDTNFHLIVKMTLLCVAPAQIYAFWRAKSALSRINNPDEPS